MTVKELFKNYNCKNDRVKIYLGKNYSASFSGTIEEIPIDFENEKSMNMELYMEMIFI